MVSDEKLIEDLQEFADELGRTPTAREMSDLGDWCCDTYRGHFGSWNNALREANLEINLEPGDRDVEDQQLIKELQEFAEELGHTPTSSEMRNSGPRGKKHYVCRFGSWNDALREAGLNIVQEKVKNPDSNHIPYGKGYSEARRKTYSRDNYNCRVCGSRSDLHCHHIMPRREFENVSKSNTLDNLIVLCRSCHTKFEGRWKEADPDTFAENAQDYLES